MTARGGTRTGAGPKPRLTGIKRFQLGLGLKYLEELDEARKILGDFGGRWVSRGEFLRRAVSGYIAALRDGYPYLPAAAGFDAQHFPFGLLEAQRQEAEAAVADGLAPSVSELIRSAGQWLAWRVLTGTVPAASLERT